MWVKTVGDDKDCEVSMQIKKMNTTDFRTLEKEKRVQQVGGTCVAACEENRKRGEDCICRVCRQRADEVGSGTLRTTARPIGGLRDTGAKLVPVPQ
jgi:hypothetical protein